MQVVEGRVKSFNLRNISQPEVGRNETSLDFIYFFLVLILDFEAYLKISEY